MKEELKNNLGGGHPQKNSIPSDSQELILTIPEELRGKELNITYGASWITNLRVNDSNNTVTGTVAANSSTSSRSSTITLTASGNLSTASPYSFTLTQSGKIVHTKIIGTWKTASEQVGGQVFNGSTIVASSSGPRNEDTFEVEVNPGTFNLTARYSYHQSSSNWITGSVYPSSFTLSAGQTQDIIVVLDS